MTDKDLIELLRSKRICTGFKPDGHGDVDIVYGPDPVTVEAADRIEALTAERNKYESAWLTAEGKLADVEAERDRLGRELNVAKYGVPDFAWSMHKIAMADLEADNTRLREALWAILACETPNANATVTRMASITKAALKGKSNE